MFSSVPLRCRPAKNRWNTTCFLSATGKYCSIFTKRVQRDILLLRFPCGSAGSEIFVLGSNHNIGSSSYNDLENLVNLVQPTAIATELCLERIRLAGVAANWNMDTPAVQIHPLTQRDNDTSKQNWFIRNLTQKFVYWRQRTEEQENNDDDGKSEYDQGEELMHALVLARRKRIPVILTDRLISVTCAHLWKVLPSLILFNIKSPHLRKDVEYEDESVKKQQQLLENSFPSLHHLLVHSRDQHFVETISSYCINQPQGQRIVAVVGRNHLRGIEKIWRQTCKNHFAASPAAVVY